jgi:hypothetical protein
MPKFLLGYVAGFPSTRNFWIIHKTPQEFKILGRDASSDVREYELIME